MLSQDHWAVQGDTVGQWMFISRLVHYAELDVRVCGWTEESGQALGMLLTKKHFLMQWKQRDGPAEGCSQVLGLRKDDGWNPLAVRGEKRRRW